MEQKRRMQIPDLNSNKSMGQRIENSGAVVEHVSSVKRKAFFSCIMKPTFEHFADDIPPKSEKGGAGRTVRH